jgi:hypothetical protein
MDGGMLFGGIEAYTVVVWMEYDTYVSMGRPTQVDVEITPKGAHHED